VQLLGVDVAERSAQPQPDRTIQHGGLLDGVVGSHRFAQQFLEHRQIELDGIEVDHVSTRQGVDQRAVVAEQLPQPGHIGLDRAPRVVGLGLGPQMIGDLDEGGRLVGAQQ